MVLYSMGWLPPFIGVASSSCTGDRSLKHVQMMNVLQVADAVRALAQTATPSSTQELELNLPTVNSTYESA